MTRFFKGLLTLKRRPWELIAHTTNRCWCVHVNAAVLSLGVYVFVYRDACRYGYVYRR